MKHSFPSRGIDRTYSDILIITFTLSGHSGQLAGRNYGIRKQTAHSSSMVTYCTAVSTFYSRNLRKHYKIAID